MRFLFKSAVGICLDQLVLGPLRMALLAVIALQLAGHEDTLEACHGLHVC